MPISVPGLIAVGVYTFMISWNEYLFALTLTRTDDMRTVPPPVPSRPDTLQLEGETQQC